MAEQVALNFAFTKPCEKLNLCKNSNCKYAHNKKEFRFLPCRNDTTCRYRKTTCKFCHTDETNDSYCARTGNSLPNFDPLPEPVSSNDKKYILNTKAKRPTVLFSSEDECERKEVEDLKQRDSSSKLTHSDYKKLKALITRLSPESQEKVSTNFSRFVETMLELEMTGNL